MKAIAENLYVRGDGNHYVRKRIPADLRASYPPKKEHVQQSLRTRDLREAKTRLRAALVLIEAEFHEKRKSRDLSQASRAAKRVQCLSDEQLRSISEFWLQQTLAVDESRRAQGLSDDEFDELDENLTSQREQLGKMLARGKSLGIFPLLHSFMHLNGLDFHPSTEEEAKRVCYAFLKSVIEGLDTQIARQAGKVIETVSVAGAAQHPLTVALASTARKGPTWEKMFETWRDYVPGRPKSTTWASKTPWNDLRRFAETKGVAEPVGVSPELMALWVEKLKARGLAIGTINERILKIRAIYKECKRRPDLGVTTNPALDTAGFKETTAQKRRKTRVPFSVSDINTIFRSPIYTEHKRSKGQSGEATYWIPAAMFYTGARPEELAGLPLSDIVQDGETGWWYLNLRDTGLDEADDGLFDGDVPVTHSRTLKNTASVRKVPVAPQLIELGLLRYVEWLRSNGETMLFPTLRKDAHEKLSGSFCKFFGRYKQVLGISDARKVLYSFRHTMKDLLVESKCPSEYMQRILGHTTGLGPVTDGYGSDLPFKLMVEYFQRVRFPDIPALPWEPGKGFITLKATSK